MADFALATSQIVRIDGSVFDSSGVPITASKDIQVKAYDAASAGTLLWTSSVFNTSVSSGRFSLDLDASSGSPTLVDQIAARSASQAVFFQVEIDTGTANGSMDSPVAITPRIRAKGTAFALNAASADNLLGVTASASELNFLSGASANVQTQLLERTKKTSAALNVYVRTDGSDSLCDGSANVAYSGGVAPTCAFATPTQAADSLPTRILHPVTVNIVSGTYYSTASGATMMSFSNSLGPQGKIYVIGSGGTPVLSGAASGAPTTPLASNGVKALNIASITLSDLQLQYFANDGIEIWNGSDGYLNNINSSNNSTSGVYCQRSSCSLSGTSVFSNNGVYGFAGAYMTDLTVDGTLTANSNAVYGGLLAYACKLNLAASGSMTLNSNTYGISISLKSELTSLGGITASSNSQEGIHISERSQATSTGPLQLNSHVIGLRVSNASSFLVNSSLSSLSATYGILVDNKSYIQSTDNVTITGAGTGGDVGIYIGRQSSMLLSPASSKVVSISRSSTGGSSGILSQLGANVTTSGAGSISIDKYTIGVNSSFISSFVGDSGGTRSITNATLSAYGQLISKWNA